MTKVDRFSTFGFFVWFLAILFYFYEFFLRVLPATLSSNLLSGLGISMEQFALIGSAYYITYSIMQVPVGLLLDKLPARLLITFAVLLCTLGTFGFAISHGFILAFISRLLIGLGSSFGFVTLMIVTLNWFPRKYFAFLVGCGQFLGSMGPLIAGAPIAMMLKLSGGNWRILFLAVAFIGVLLTFLVAIFIRDKPERDEMIYFIDIEEPFFKRIKHLLSSGQVWAILIYSGCIYVALPLLGAFWGTLFLEKRGFDKTAAALIVSMLWVGLAVGSPLFGRISDALVRRAPILALSAILGLVGSAALLITPSTNLYYLCFLFFLIGLGGAGQNLSFAVISEHAPDSLRATALGSNNTILMAFAATVPPCVTFVIQAGGGTLPAFIRGFTCIPIFFAVALILSLFIIKETYCRQQNRLHHI